MKHLLSFLVFFFVTSGTGVYGQAPRFEKYAVAETGSFIYMPLEPVWDLSLSEDSSIIYMADVEVDSVDYGAIVVKFQQEIPKDEETWNTLMTNYLEYLATNVFQLKEMVPPGYGHTLQSHPEALGIIAYGVDYDDYNFAIKVWMDSKYMAILMVVANKEVNFTTQELYLNGFRFPTIH